MVLKLQKKGPHYEAHKNIQQEIDNGLLVNFGLNSSPIPKQFTFGIDELKEINQAKKDQCHSKLDLIDKLPDLTHKFAGIQFQQSNNDVKGILGDDNLFMPKSIDGNTLESTPFYNETNLPKSVFSNLITEANDETTAECSAPKELVNTIPPTIPSSESENFMINPVDFQDCISSIKRLGVISPDFFSTMDFDKKSTRSVLNTNTRSTSIARQILKPKEINRTICYNDDRVSNFKEDSIKNSTSIKNNNSFRILYNCSNDDDRIDHNNRTVCLSSRQVQFKSVPFENSKMDLYADEANSNKSDSGSHESSQEDDQKIQNLIKKTKDNSKTINMRDVSMAEMMSYRSEYTSKLPELKNSDQNKPDLNSTLS